MIEYVWKSIQDFSVNKGKMLLSLYIRFNNYKSVKSSNAKIIILHTSYKDCMTIVELGSIKLFIRVVPFHEILNDLKESYVIYIR